jgi:predicted nuclease of predicted toxin-antitoxin system
VKVLLDAMYSPEVAVRLRNRHHDAVAIVDRPDLVHVTDRELYAAMASEGRVFITNNAVDYVPLLRAVVADGSDYPVILLTSDRLMPRNRPGIGRFLNALEDLFVDITSGRDQP